MPQTATEKLQMPHIAATLQHLAGAAPGRNMSNNKHKDKDKY
jgi:hypothetical protein